MKSLNHSLKSIVKQGRHSAVSIIGLAVALCCSILILLYIRFELSYDKFHKNASGIYRIITKQAAEFSYKGTNLFVPTPGTLKDALLTEIPQATNATKCFLRTHTLEYNKSLFNETGFLYADSDFLEVFSFPVLRGNPQTLLEPFSLFITERMAGKYFGKDDPVGKTVKADNKYIFTVKGIMKDIPLNSHFSFDFLTGFETLYQVRGGRERVENWSNFNYSTYLQLPENISTEVVSAKLAELPKKYLTSSKIFNGTVWALQPLKEIHLGGNANFELSKNSDIRYIYLVGSIAIFILIIACFNYMNLATARSFSRGKEIGIRKVSGCSRRELIFQLLLESVLLSLAGLILALAITPLILPFFAGFTERPLVFSMIFEPLFLAGILLLTIVTGIISGIIPAIRLSSYNPLNLINEEYVKQAGNRRRNILKDTLVVIQYFISLVALVSTFTIIRQLYFIKNSDTGYSSDNILNIRLNDPALRKDPDIVLSELGKSPYFEDFARSTALPSSVNSATMANWDGKPEDVSMTIYNFGADDRFINFFRMKIIDGRAFSQDFSDGKQNNCIINQAAAKKIGWTDPVGKKFWLDQDHMGTVIGVIKDFNFMPLNLPVEPLVIYPVPSDEYGEVNTISVRINSLTVHEARDFIDQTLGKLSPSYINPVTIMSDTIAAMYSDRKLSSMIMFSTLVAIILTCLGQYSLSFFTAKKRTREMAIRKVYGATPVNVMKIMTGEVLMLILISLLPAWPAARILMNRWLQDFAFRISPETTLMITGSFIIILLVSLLVASYHVIRLSGVNPAETIRYQ